MISAQTVLDELVGRALGGVLFAVAPIVPFIVDGVTFLVGGAAASRITDPLEPDVDTGRDGTDESATTGSMYRQDLADGFGFLWGHELLRRKALAIGLINLGAATGASVLVILVIDDLDASEVMFGLVLSAGAIGGLLGSVVAEHVTAAVGRGAVLVGSVIVMGAGLVTVALSPNVVVVGIGMFVQGFGVTTSNVPGRALRQEVTPDRLLGRVITSYRVFGYVGVPLGAGLGGLVTDILDVRTAFVVAAGVMVAGAVLMAGAVRHLPERAG